MMKAILINPNSSASALRNSGFFRKEIITSGRYLAFAAVFLLGGRGFSQPLLPTMSEQAHVLYYKGNNPYFEKEFIFTKNKSEISVNDEAWVCEKSTGKGQVGVQTMKFQLLKGRAEKAGVALRFLFDNWSKDNYVIMPSAAYNGNRFDVLPYGYPPLFKKKDYSKNLPITITDVPRLAKYDGESRMDLNTGDLATPAVGIFFPKTKQGVWILTEQATEVGNSVFIFKENEARDKAEFIIAAPCVREKYYSMTRLSPSNETGVDFKKGDQVTIRYKVYTFTDISSPKDLNNKFLSIRKAFGKSEYSNQLPFSKAFDLMEKQENEWWSEADSLYTLGGEGWNMKWQLGWVGGCMVTLPLSEVGDDVSAERAFKNYHRVITKSQANSGFYYSCGNGKEWCSDCFGNPHPDNLLLVRKNADALYFIYKYCFSQKAKNPQWQMPVEWRTPLEKLGNAFEKLWNDNRQFGQFIDIETGQVIVGGSNSAAMAVAGLALASKYENKASWLQAAEDAAKYYYENYTVKGISCGGPSEILQNNDSESAFAMLEAFVVLYEITGKKKWLTCAEDAAAFCATWMVSYDYKFPATTLFGGLNMKTTGAIWASTQNKHGGPGICTASGDCLLKLYRATGKKYYLAMLYDVAHNIMQYIARADRPIKNQRIGWINERVNLSDWEGKNGVGNIFDGNTWAQVSAMLTVAEVPGIYLDYKKKELTVFDHVEGKLEGEDLVVKNPTQFDARVRIFIDKTPMKSYGQGFISNCPTVFVKAGETKRCPLSSLK